MRVHQFVVVLALLSSVAVAEGPSDPGGLWTLPGSPKCAFTFDLRDGKVTRKTGTLIYTTRVKLVADGEGWLLDEELENYNDGVSCRGDVGSTVVAHLKKKARIELKDGRLLYFRQKGQPLAHSFVRSST